MASTCINVAIIPTESLVGSARTLLTCRHAGTMGVRVDGASDTWTCSARTRRAGVGGMWQRTPKMSSDFNGRRCRTSRHTRADDRHWAARPVNNGECCRARNHHSRMPLPTRPDDQEAGVGRGVYQGQFRKPILYPTHDGQARMRFPQTRTCAPHNFRGRAA